MPSNITNKVDFPRELDDPVIVSFSGHRVDTSDAQWRLSPQHVVDLGWIDQVDHSVGQALRLFAKHLVANYSADYVRGQLGYLKKLSAPEVAHAIATDLALDDAISFETYAAYGQEVERTVSKVHRDGYLGAFVRWYLWCLDGSLSAFDADIGAEFDRIEFRDPPKGVAVMRQDPTAGPLARQEYEALQDGLRSDLAKRLSLSDRVAAWLFIAFGTNTKNLVWLDEGDLITTTLSDGVKVHELRIPRIKKRTAGPRDQFRIRKLIPEIAELVRQLIAENGPASVVSDSAARPLFRRNERQALIGTEFENERFRSVPADLQNALDRVVKVLDLRARDGSVLNLTCQSASKKDPLSACKRDPFVEQRDEYDGRTVRAGCGVGRA